MRKMIKIHQASTPTAVFTVKYCDSFFSKLQGLMFSQELQPDEGVILVDKKETRFNAAIHMLFMNYDLTVLWLDRQRVVVDKALAKRWAPFYVPKKPAQYILELHPDKYDDFKIGDQIFFIGESED